MLKRSTLLLFIVLIAFIGTTSAQAVMLDTAQDQYVKVSDVNLRYKVWGKGEPILLLHGAMEYWREWRTQIPVFAKQYKVIAVDTRGHGESTFTDRELSYELMADDMLDMMAQLGLDSINVVGFGDGGIIGMIMAAKQPTKFRKLVAIGANLDPDTTSVYPEVLTKVKAWDYDKMAFYLQVKFKENPNVKLLPAMARRMQKLLLTQPRLTTRDLANVACPTLIMAGDRDFVKLSHSSYIAEHLPNGYLSIIPGTSHYCMKEKPSTVNTTILDFLKWKAEKAKRF
jgi:pimeloyl-ACP methyl ester carboxylesterase